MTFNLEDLLLYRDACLLVINKPSGLPVHKGSGPYPALETLFNQLKFGLPKTPMLVHRLDRETSGCLVLARHVQAAKKMGQLFESNQVNKFYTATVRGTPPDSEGEINAPLGPQSNRKDLWHMKIDFSGKPAVTRYKVLQQFNGMTLLQLQPITGRTHQLRVHCAYIDCPIIGDRIYGNHSAESDPQRLMCLHATQITIPYYKNKEAIKVTAPLPPHFNQWI